MVEESTEHIKEKRVLKALASVSDPEIPVLSIMDMGVVREIQVDGKEVIVKITPTYSGCPAMDTITDDIKKVLTDLALIGKVEPVLSPAWTTDWITPEGRRKLEEYGIAAPLDEESDKRVLVDGAQIVKCTNCGSTNTRLVSQFGSTTCKALFKCDDCLEPFDYFKCLK